MTAVSTPTAKPEFDQSKLKDSYCVTTGNKLGAWNDDFLLFTEIGQPQYRLSPEPQNDASGTQTKADPGAPLTICPKMLAFKSASEMWVVDIQGDVYQWKRPTAASPSNGWTKLTRLETVTMIAFNKAGVLTAVIKGKVVQWTTSDYASQWTDINQSPDWHVNMIAFDKDDVMWCVARDPQGVTRVAHWNKDHKRWASLGELPGEHQHQAVTMIGFDPTSTMWIVYAAPPAEGSSTSTAEGKNPPPAADVTGDKIAYWDATNEAWVDPVPAKLMLPSIQWLTWKPAAA